MASNKRKRKKSSSKETIKKNPFYKTWWFGLIIGVILGFSISSLGNNNNTTDKKANNISKTSDKKKKEVNNAKEKTEESKKEVEGDFVKKASDAYFDGTILKGNSYSVRITNHQVIPVGEKGNEHGENAVIAIWYETIVSPEYKDDKAINPSIAWMMNFKAIQDNDDNKVNELSVAALPDEAFLKSQMADIKPGGPVENAVAYELTDETTPVKLISETMMGDKLGETEFKIK